MSDDKIVFQKLPLPTKGKQLFQIYFVVKNGKSQVMDGYRSLPQDKKDEVKDLIIKMATVENFKSDKIRWRLQKKYSYGELKPRGHRFFFFLKFGHNIIFFKYAKKKKNSLGYQFYKDTELEKNRYEREFKKSI